MVQSSSFLIIFKVSSNKKYLVFWVVVRCVTEASEVPQNCASACYRLQNSLLSYTSKWLVLICSPKILVRIRIPVTITIWQRWKMTFEDKQGLVVLPSHGWLPLFPYNRISLISRYIFFQAAIVIIFALTKLDLLCDPSRGSGQFWWWRLFTFWERNVPGPLPQRCSKSAS